MQAPLPSPENNTRLTWVVVVLIVLTFLLPVAFHWAVMAGVAAVSPAQTRRDLASYGPGAALVDVRSASEYRQGHIAGAVNWPYSEMRRPMPESLAGKRLYLICNSGIQSARAARVLSRVASTPLVSVQGGMEGWGLAESSPSVGCCGGKPAASDPAVPFRDSSGAEQWVAVVTGFVIKPFYMVLSLVLIIALRQSRATDLVSLRWSMVFFLIGEIFCAVNYLFFHDGSVLSEYLHSYGMTAAFGFAAFALVEGVDGRIVKFTDPQKRCSFLELCGPCSKYADAACGLRRLLLFLLPCTFIVVLMPLFAQARAVSYNTSVWGTLYNYSHPLIYQLFEIRYCPVVAAILIAFAWIALLRKAVRLSKVLFAAGVGAFGFGLFRLILFDAYQTNLLWFNTWEEVTELIFVVGVAVALWIFRSRLFEEKGYAADRRL